MPDCECIKGCVYFHMTTLQEIEGILELRKQKYCQGDNTLCARYTVFKTLGRGYVPEDLLPSQTDRARELIEQATPLQQPL